MVNTPPKATIPLMAPLTPMTTRKRAAESLFSDEIKVKRTKLHESPFLREMGTEFVELFVGEEEEPFRIHKKKLCDKIPYFNTMFNSDFQEGRDSRAFSPKGKVVCFDMLQYWLYHGSLPGISEFWDKSQNNWKCSLLSVYSLADKFLLPSLMDEVMDLVIAHCNAQMLFPTLRDAITFYEITLQGSALRKFASRGIHYVLDQPVTSDKAIWRIEDIYQAIAECPALEIDVLESIRLQGQGKRVKDPRKAPACDFH
ncbi:hypothetical protein B0J14DRAFT_641646 [Halenospora varia]|nr:hypothetical protein B0J14DRAFT_641646 [Halenospora varia]